MDPNKVKKILATAAGILDRPLRQWAQKLAERLPQKHWIKSGGAETILGVIKAAAEAYGANLNPVISVAIEKLTDFGDFFAGALGVGPGKNGEKLENWFEGFLKAAIQEKTKDLKGLQEILQLIEVYKEWVEGKKPSPSPASPQKDWSKTWKKLEASLKKGYQVVSGQTSKIVYRLEEINRKSARWRLL